MAEQAEKNQEIKRTETPEEHPKRKAPELPAGKLFIWGTGRRKSSIARVRIRPGSGKILINKREVNDYFYSPRDRSDVTLPLEALNMLKEWDVFVNVQGGGLTGQAGAIRLGLSRALSNAMPDADRTLRHKGLLTRDPRMKERKKPGQKGARKQFQFSKR